MTHRRHTVLWSRRRNKGLAGSQEGRATPVSIDRIIAQRTLFVNRMITLAAATARTDPVVSWAHWRSGGIRVNSPPGAQQLLHPHALARPSFPKSNPVMSGTESADETVLTGFSAISNRRA